MSVILIRALNRRFDKVWPNNGGLGICLVQRVNWENHNLTFRTYRNIESNKSLVHYAKAAHSSSGTIQESSTLVSSKEYIMMYKFSYIRVGGILNKLKKWFTITVIAGSPLTVGMKSLDIISSDTMTVFFVLGGATCFALYSAGMIFYKLVGSMYLSTDGSTVKVSYLDFWGRRVDTFCTAADVVPLSDLAEKTTDPYVNFRQYSNPTKKLHLTVRFGHIIDSDLFTRVFGKEF